MKVTKGQLRQIIKEQIIDSLNSKEQFASVERRLWESRRKQTLNEKWLQKLLGTWSPTDKDIEDMEIADKIEDAAGAAAVTLRDQGTYTKKQAEDTVKRFLDGDPELSRVDHKDLSRIFFDLGKDAASQIASAEAAEDAKGDPPTKSTEGDAAAAPEEAKPASVTKTAKDIRDLIVDPTQRRMLLRGLLSLLTNDSVERSIAIIKPEQAKTAVLNFLKQIVDMEPKAYKKFRAGMQKKIYSDMIASDSYTAGRTSKRDYNLRRARTEKGMAAGKTASAELGKLGLSEGVDKQITEAIAVLEAFDLYFEKIHSNKR